MNDAVTFGMEFFVAVLAQQEPNQPGPEFGKASPFGMLVIALLLVATFLLVWSMNRHLRKLPKSFDASEGDDAAAESSAEEPPATGEER
ncbi:hypothetical protein [Mycolicibacterium pulveris]|uniref:hypothetical protein n=1 Tax=Mycolicibacterium pulveris TaxID=36813 RepID=UPI003CFB938A